MSVSTRVLPTEATDAEIEENEFCVICRDSLFEGSKPKKLSCGHIFHIDCLKSWLVMQQVCPTCRSEIRAEGPAHTQTQMQREEDTGLAAAQAAAAAAQAQIAAQRRPPAPSQPGSASSAAPPENAPVAPAPDGRAQAPIFERPAMAVPAASTGASSSHANGQGFAASEPAQAAAAAAAYPLAASRQVAPSSALSSLPPLEEITTALDRAEEMAKFLREQQDFWMEQVRQIQAGRSGQAVPSPETVAPNEPATEAEAEPEDQLAELRRARQEQWIRKRSQTQSGDAPEE
eukprot:s787_g4.t1